jgi:hypothetical protein
MYRRALRIFQALLLAIGVTAVPVATVMACSCAATDFNEAVATADLAIVGTAIAAEPASNDEFGQGALLTKWQLSRSRDPLGTDSIAIRSVKDSGANCGISFGSGERWIVLAYRGEQGLETNGCMQNRRLDGSDPEMESAVDSMLPEVTAVEPEAESGLQVPAPIVLLAAAGLFIGVASLIAFRRAGPS